MVTSSPALVGPAGFSWTAVVLCGGRASRLGSDKAQLVVDGKRLIDRFMTALPLDVAIVLVGPDPGVMSRPVTITREDPAFGGPVAALAAALPFVRSEAAGIVAVDMPFATEALTGMVNSLRDWATDGVDCVVPVDGEGRRQPLCAAYRMVALRDALSSMPSIAGSSMRELLSRMVVGERRVDPHWLIDIDTTEDLADVSALSGPSPTRM